MTELPPDQQPPLTPVESPGGRTIIVDSPAPAPAPILNSSNPPIILRSPLKYNPTLSSSTNFQPPPLQWLERTWTITHSTLPMWRKAKNVRITYKLLPPTKEGAPSLLDDTVSSTPTQRTLLPQPKAIKGIDTPAPSGPNGEDAGWDWRGKGWLKIASSHWEVLGWGERREEKWVVTWFAPSMFTPAGMDVYCDGKGGMSEGLFGDIERALESLEAKEMAELCGREMREVVIDDSWGG